MYIVIRRLTNDSKYQLSFVRFAEVESEKKKAELVFRTSPAAEGKLGSS